MTVPNLARRSGFIIHRQSLAKVVIAVMVLTMATTLWFAPTETSTAFNLSAPPAPAPGPAPPQPTPAITDLTGAIDSQGKFIQPVVAVSQDRVVNIFIKMGTQVIGIPRGISITRLSAIPGAPWGGSYMLTASYDFAPAAITFRPPIAMTFTYNTAGLPPGFLETELVIAYWDIATWVILDNAAVDTTAHTITSQVSHFTPFTVMAYKRPATFVPSLLTITPAEANIGQQVTINVTITNTGYVSGTADVVLRVDEKQVAIQKVDIVARTSQQVFFYISREELGRHNINVNGLTSSFIVRTPSPTPTISRSPPPAPKPAPKPTPTPTPTPTPPPALGPVATPPATTAPPLPPSAPTNWVPVFVILAVVVLSPLAWWLYGRPRR